MVKKVTNLTKFRLLLWKNFVLQRNHKCQVTCEIITPTFFALFIVLMRVVSEVHEMPVKHFKEVPIKDLNMLLQALPEDRMPDFRFAYSPNNHIVEKIVEEAQKKVGIAGEVPSGFANAAALERALKKYPRYIVGIEFDDRWINIDDYPKIFHYKLRFRSELRTLELKFGSTNIPNWQTDRQYPDFPSRGPRNSDSDDDGAPAGYFREGFIPIQHAIFLSYLELAQGNKKQQMPEVVMQRFPYAEFTSDTFMEIIPVFLPLCLVISFLAFAMHVTRYIAEEKEKQLKEIMKMVGISNWLHWMAWFVRSMILIGIPMNLILTFFKVLFGKSAAVFPYSNWSILFLFLVVYAISIVTFCFMISVFFKKATVASTIAGLLFYLTYMPATAIEKDYREMSAFSKGLSALDFNLGMYYSLKIICGWEGIARFMKLSLNMLLFLFFLTLYKAAAQGAQWSNIFEPVNEDDNISLGLILFMMLLASGLYLAICLYVEQVFPGEFGAPKKWNFLFNKNSYKDKRKQYEFNDRNMTERLEKRNSPAFEQQPRNKRIGIEIKGLKKRFGTKWAVKGVTLNMYEDEITVLLGHNGAGKTTTISMLTGITVPTAGTAKINGYDIRLNIENARNSLGICPQINVLFDDMSVANHLIFFSKLKGLSGKAVEVEVNKYLHIMQLTEKANALSKTLSGGMKRKLTLCNALCGGTKVVLCDEPSSGLDPSARRQLWDLMQAEKIGRTVLLTTHFMDEADVLGDRIAIMCDGEVKCHGSPFFLKKKFGSGYRLICVKNEDCEVENVTKLLQKYIPEIEPENEIGTELTYRLPDEFSNIFGNIFIEIENKLEDLGLSGFGVGITSLEEVFMKVGAENANPSKRNKMENYRSDDELNTSDASEDPTRFAGGADENPDDNEKLKKSKIKDDISKQEELAQDSDESYKTAKWLSQQSKQEELAQDSDESYKTAILRSQQSMHNEIAKGEKLQDIEPEIAKRRETTESSASEDDDRNTKKKQKQDKDSGAEKEKEDEKKEQKMREKEESKQREKDAEVKRREKTPEDFRKQRLHYEIVENESQQSLRTKGRSLTLNQWHAMSYKKFKYIWRNKTFLILQNTIGILFVIIAAIISKVDELENLPPMTFGLKQYSKTISYLEKTVNVDPNSLEDIIGNRYREIAGANGDKYEIKTSSGTDGKAFEKFILDLSRKNQATVNRQYLTAAAIDRNKITVWFNNQPLHVAPLALNLIHNAMAKAVLGDEAEITVTNHPIRFSFASHLYHFLVDSSGFIIVLFMGYAMAFITAFFAIPLIKEKQSRCKLLQFVSGVRVWTFWLTHFLFDLLSLVVTVILMFICLACFQLSGYTKAEHLGLFFLLTFLFCVSVLPLVYILSSLFTEPAAGFSRISIIFFISGLGLLIMFVIFEKFLKQLKFDISTELLRSIFVLFPHFSFTNAWIELDLNIGAREICKSNLVTDIFSTEQICEFLPFCCNHEPYFGMESPGILLQILGMLLTFTLSIVLLILHDYGLNFTRFFNCTRQKYKPGDDVDDDVIVERNRVQNMSAEDRTDHFLVLDNLAKFYGKFLAVNFLSLAVKGKECFGLLGVNGAGKTTTFRMLTGDVIISSGNAYVRGISIRTQKLKVYRKIGYCPQSDALIEDLTGREIMFIFCLLRGIPVDKIKTTSEELAKALGFMKHIDKKSVTYSGGNKRKLSIAIAIIGAPSVIYLDEPTAGLDPAARRQLWNIICLLRDHGKLIILTSHSMDECEALCTRLAVMVNGEFKCIGSAQHLKNKFSKGLVLKVQAERITETRSSDPSSRLSLEMETTMNRIKEAILTKYPSAVIQSEYQSLLTVYIPLVVIKWSEIFSWMEENREELKIEDYSIGQTSLEEIFLDFAKTQNSDTRVQGALPEDRMPDFRFAYSPNNHIIQKIVEEAQKKVGLVFDVPSGYANAAALERALEKYPRYIVGIEFDDSWINIDDYPKIFHYKLRFKSELRTLAPQFSPSYIPSWETNFRYPYPSPGPRNSDSDDDGAPAGYFREGFIPIQHAIFLSYLELAQGNKKQQMPEVVMRRFPYAEYTQDKFMEVITNNLALCLVVSFLAFSTNVTRYIAEEKEKQLKEIMKMVGISNWLHWMAWFVRSMILIGISIILILMLFTISFGKSAAVFTYSSWSILFLFFVVYAISIITFCFMISVFFKKAAVASTIAGLLFYITYMPVSFIEEDYHEMSAFSKGLLALDFNLGMAFSMKIICGWEAAGQGAQWSNIFEPVNEDDNISLGLILFMMLLASGLYLAICLYVEQVFPGEFGAPKKWNFLFNKNSYIDKRKQYERSDRNMTEHLPKRNSAAFEQEPRNKRIGIEIKGLKKRFGTKWAVKGVTLNMYEDEITVLLGHNGAGKTTTISMLTGMTLPTAGTAKINGYDIRLNIENARNSLGICPQINVLFDDMSVADHLIFFSKLKGLSGKAVEVEVNKYLHIMQLTKKAKALSKTLSGGMKRKLTLCNALCGDTKVVLCDEPSSGLDPSARRQLWDLMQAEKIGRTVLLTTHFMDEADVLGDRIAIMCDGEVKCHGSPFFLKKKFGSGYRLICVKNEDCEVENITKLLQKYIPELEPESQIGTELTYRLPDEFSNIFSNIFIELENKLEDLDLSGFGVGITSLEEVFMKIGAEVANPSKRERIENHRSDDELNTSDASEDPTRFTGGADKNPDDNEKLKKSKIPDDISKEEELAQDSDESYKSAKLLSPQSMHDEIAKGENLQDIEPEIAKRRGATESSASEDEDRKTKKKPKEDEDSDIEKEKEDERKERKMRKEEERKQREKDAELKRREKTPEDFRKQRLLYEILENESQHSLRTKGRSLTLNQWHAMFYKKFKYTWRNKTLLILQNTIAILFVIWPAILAESNELKNLPPMTFGLNQYSKTISYLEKTANVDPESLEDIIGNRYREIAGANGDKYEVKTSSETDGQAFEKFILDLSRKNQATVNRQYLAAATIDQKKITVWFNNQPLHVAPLALNLIHNAMAKVVLGDEAEITVTNHPIRYSPESHLNKAQAGATGKSFVLFIGFSMSFITALYAIPLIKEKQSRCKLLQFVSGVRVWTFWLTHFLWDLLSLVVIVILMFTCLACFQLSCYSKAEHLGIFFLLTFLLCVTVLPLVYILSGLFTEPAAGFSRISIIFFFSGIGLYTIFSIFKALSKLLKFDVSTELLRSIFVLFPHFSFTNAWVELDTNIRNREICKSDLVKDKYSTEQICQALPLCCNKKPFFDMKNPGILLEILAMLLVFTVTCVILISHDYGLSFTRFFNTTRQKYKPGDDVDEDVIAERNRVKNMSAEDRTDHFLVLDNLAKFYGKFLAVNFLSLAIKGKECFGLLGVNGAGKTTTFRMLTGDVIISSGNAYVRGINLRTQKLKVYRKIGYCPQSDALIEDLTGREIMFIFCLLRGIPVDKIKTTSEELAKALGFMKHIDKKSVTYSGGNKRKLNIAIAIIGVPSVIYLDEPTSGVDPAARRQLWNIICLLRDHGKVIILTSHSMDECEALCTRLAVMVNGEFKCIGSAQHLKNKFSKGLVLKVQAERITATRSSDPGARLSLEMQKTMNRIKEAILTKYPSAVIQSEYQSMLTIYIPLVVIKWSEIFSWMEENREELKIEDYSISQTSLEEIFLDFAKTQNSDTRVQGGCRCC